MRGSTLLMSGAVDVLKTAYAVVPLVNADDNRYTFDENLQLGNYLEGVHHLFDADDLLLNGGESPQGVEDQPNLFGGLGFNPAYSLRSRRG